MNIDLPYVVESFFHHIRSSMSKEMGKRQQWDPDQMPSQQGRVAVVTGANSGLGYHISRALAMKGARVIMACRNLEKGAEALRKMVSEEPPAEPVLRKLDLSDLTSVRQFAEGLQSENRIDLLINNAGLMAIPLQRTREGFEMQFGVNHLGHFALTAQLWPLLEKTEGSRVVNVSSAAHRFGRIHYEDIHWEKSYSKWGAYGMSKIANLLFTSELAKRIKQRGLSVTAATAHPGYASTELQTKGAVMEGSRWKAWFFRLANRLVAQPAAMGALPILFAATAGGVAQGDFYGPGGVFRMKGWPAPDTPSRKRMSAEDAEQLWVLSEKLTGVTFPL
jgi:NAD(P)-dependent dehydrogenase (short-subunit alcohol dehydrogenase family)